MRRLSMFVVLCGCAADTSSGPELLAGFVPPAPPDNGMQVILPIVHDLQPGSDNELCTWSDKFLDEDVDAKVITAFQSEVGHHVSLYTTFVKQPPGTTRPCTDLDMATFRFAAASGGEGTGLVNEAPGDLVYRLEKGTQLVFNHHYINATDEVMDGQAGVNIEFAKPGTTRIPSGTLAILNTDLNIQPGTSSVDITCTMQHDLKAWWAVPHMHAYGTHILFDLIRNDVSQPLFDIDWKESYMFHPPEIRKDPATPMMLQAGDKVHLRCDYANTTASPLTFGIEMCVGFASTIDDQALGNIDCDSGNWGTF